MKEVVLVCTKNGKMLDVSKSKIIITTEVKQGRAELTTWCMIYSMCLSSMLVAIWIFCYMLYQFSIQPK